MGPLVDVAIVGAGPAGALAAISALQTHPGARVLLLDAAGFPRDKVCGDAVGARCFDLLSRFNLGLSFDDFKPVHEFALESRTASARHLLRSPVRVIPRRIFDARLVAAAVEAGAMLEQRRVHRVELGTDSVVLDEVLRCSVVVGADGAESVVRRSLPDLGTHRKRIAVAVRGYGPTSSSMPRIVSQGHAWPAYAWEFPLGDGTSNIGYLDVPRPGHVPTKREMLSAATDLLPEAASGVSDWRGHRLPFSSARPHVGAGRVLLAGDAAALVNPLSGEGIFDALLSGSLAGQAAFRGSGAGAAYGKAMRSSMGWHHLSTRVAARLLAVDPVAALGLRLAESDAGFFNDVIDLCMGDAPIRPLSAARALVRTRQPLREGKH